MWVFPPSFFFNFFGLLTSSHPFLNYALSYLFIPLSDEYLAWLHSNPLHSTPLDLQINCFPCLYLIVLWQANPSFPRLGHESTLFQSFTWHSMVWYTHLTAEITKRNPISSLGILVYGTVIYERRVTMISKRTGNFGESFLNVSFRFIKRSSRSQTISNQPNQIKQINQSIDIIVGPTLICFFLFTALLTNFIYRFSEAKHVSGSNPFNVLNAWTQAGAKSTWL